MTISRSEDLLVGLVALAAAGWLGWMLRRGLRDARLAIGKGEVLRAERPGAFNTLFAFYVIAASAMIFIGLDLLVDLNLGN